MKKLFLTGILIFVGLHPAMAKISTSLSETEINMGQTVYLTISQEGTGGFGTTGGHDLSPLEKDFKIVSSSQSTSSVTANGQVFVTNKTKLGLTPKREGTLEIPEIKIGKEKTDKLRLVVRPVGSSYGTDNDGSGNGGGSEIFVKAAVDDENPFEQSQVIYTLRAYLPVSENIINGTFGKPVNGDCIVEPMGKVTTYESRINNVRYLVFEQKFAVFPTKPGKMEIGSDGVRFILEDKASTPQQQTFSGFPFGSRFNFFAKQKEVFLKAEPLFLDVKPKPARYGNKVWLPAQSLTVELDMPPAQTAFKTGDPIDVTIILKATGLLQQHLPDPKIPEIKGLKIYAGETKKDNFFNENVNGYKEITFAMIPVSAGEFVIPGSTIPWYNTVTGKDEVLTVPEIRIKASGTTKDAEDAASSSPPAAIPAEASSASPLPESSPSDRTGILLTGIFSGLGIAAFIGLLSYLFFFSRKKNESEAASYKRDLKSVKNACELSNPKLIQDSILHWAKLHLKSKPNSLAKIAKALASEELAVEFEKIGRAIYSHGDPSFDGMAVYEAFIAAIGKKAKKTEKNGRNQVPELYPF